MTLEGFSIVEKEAVSDLHFSDQDGPVGLERKRRIRSSIESRDCFGKLGASKGEDLFRGQCWEKIC